MSFVYPGVSHCLKCGNSLKMEEFVICSNCEKEKKEMNFNKQEYIHQNIKHSEICPVCKGKCSVQSGFYSGNNEYGTYITNSTGLETCRSCNGKGYIIIS